MTCHIDSEDKYKSYVIEFVRESLNDFPHTHLKGNEQEFIEYLQESVSADKLINNHPSIVCRYSDKTGIRMEFQGTINEGLTQMAYECFWTDAYETAKEIEELTKSLINN